MNLSASCVVIIETYNSGLFLIQVRLMLLDAFLASEENVAISQVLLLSILDPAKADLAWQVIVTGGIGRRLQLRIGPLRLVTDKTERVDLNLLAFNQSS